MSQKEIIDLNDICKLLTEKLQELKNNINKQLSDDSGYITKINNAIGFHKNNILKTIESGKIPESVTDIEILIMPFYEDQYFDVDNLPNILKEKIEYYTYERLMKKYADKFALKIKYNPSDRTVKLIITQKNK